MKEKLVSIKDKILTKNFIKKSFFVAVLLIFFIVLYVNQHSLQFWVNGFSKMFDCDLQVYFLDVGQANSTLIIFPNKMAMLVDTGSQDSGESLVENVDYILHKNEIEEIEYVILTHSDEDHVGGTVEILNKFQVNNILRPKQLAKDEECGFDYNIVTTDIYQSTISAVYAEPDCNVQFINDVCMNFFDVKVEIFSCQKDKYSATNSYSPFIFIDYNDKTFLLTGDATSTRENELINYLNLNTISISVDYLLVSHHGSKYSTTEEFLTEINPRLAFVSAGEDYYPSIEVKERLNAHGVEDILATNKLGTLAVGVDGSSEIIVDMSNFLDLPFIFVCGSIVIFAFIKFPFFQKGKFVVKKQKFSVK